jgi:hypothetical protein
MGQTLYITDPVVAAAYFVHPAEFVWITSEAEALWLLASHHAYSLNHSAALPQAYYVHPDAPPFVPLPDPTPPGTQPAEITVTPTWVSPTVWDVVFGGVPDTAHATGAFIVVNDAGAVVVNGSWSQAPGTTVNQAVSLFISACAPFSAVITTQKFGNRVELRGVGGTVIKAVRAVLNVPKAAADEAAAPPPELPAAQTSTVEASSEDSAPQHNAEGAAP